MKKNNLKENIIKRRELLLSYKSLLLSEDNNITIPEIAISIGCNIQALSRTAKQLFTEEEYNIIKKNSRKKSAIKYKKICIKRYGTDNYTKTVEYKNKTKETNLKKYGVENPAQNNNIKEKIKKTVLEKYGVDHYNKTDKSKQQHTETNLKKYGVEYVLQSDFFKNKYKETCLSKYGVDNPSKRKEFSDMFKNEAFLSNKKAKSYETMKRNGTFNTSKTEKIVLEIIKNKFPDIKYHYKDEKYPFNCDFYIPSLDLYIEYNGTWTHGFAPFDNTNENHISKLNNWKNHSKASKYYKQAIYVWTDLDVRKRETAKINKINFIEFWNIDEVKAWLSNQ